MATSFAVDIRPLFRDSPDVDSMQGYGLDLSSYADVKARAAAIYEALANGSMHLVVHRFSTGSIGLASPCASVSSRWSAKQNPAVCVPPGARLILLDVPKRLQQDMV